MVARKIVFYRWASVNAQVPFSPHKVAGALAENTAKDDYAAMLESHEITTAVHVVSAGDEVSPTRLRVLSLRNPDHRPLQWELGGDLAPLPLLDDQYPADVTYVSIWPDGIAAQDLYTDAPRLGRLSHFLRNKASSHISFDPLYQPDVYRKLQDLQGQLRWVSIAMMQPEYTNRERGVLGSFLPAIYGPKAPSLRVEVGMGRYVARDQYLDEAADEAVFRIAESAHQYVDSLIVRGRSRETKRIEELNLMKQRLQHEVELPASPKALTHPDADAAFREMEKAYQTFRQEGTFDRAVQAMMMRQR